MKKQNKFCISFIYFITAALVAFVFFFGLTTGANTYAADNAVSSFDDTNVVEDLKTANFKLEEYPKKADGKIRVIYFVEYGYNIRANEQANYGLYLYVYNPAEVNINVDGKNFVQISSKRNADGKPTDYSKYAVKCVSKSSGVYGKLFYKFKVVAGLSEQLAYIDDDVRRYDVSGIELQTAGEANATEYPISTTFYYSGYAKGFGKDKTADSTLSCRSESLEVIDFDVYPTVYRWQNGLDTAAQVNSVYFSVPQKYFENGNLYEIKSSFNEQKTKDIIVTSNDSVYSGMFPLLDVNIGKHSDVWDKCLVDSGRNSGGWCYNLKNNTTSIYTPKISWLFSTKGQSIYDFYLSPDILEEYIYSHKGYELFADNVDTGRTKGEQTLVLNVDDTFDLKKFDNSSFSDWWDSLWRKDLEDQTRPDITPIYEVKASDIQGTDENISKNLLVHKNDIATFKTFFNAERKKGNRVFLFRFANTEYLSRVIDCSENKVFPEMIKEQVMRVYQTVFLDFDVIYLGFGIKNNLTIIPVVSSPVNVIGGVDAANKPSYILDKAEDWFKDLWNNLQSTKDKILNVLKWVGIALGSILVVLLLYIVIKAIVKACTAVAKKRQNNRYTKK